MLRAGAYIEGLWTSPGLLLRPVCRHPLIWIPDYARLARLDRPAVEGVECGDISGGLLTGLAPWGRGMIVNTTPSPSSAYGRPFRLRFDLIGRGDVGWSDLVGCGHVPDRRLRGGYSGAGVSLSSPLAQKPHAVLRHRYSM